MDNHAAGISIVAFIITVSISLGYYQFVYVPQANAKPQVSAEILNPPQATNVIIAPGSSSPSQTKNFTPKEADGALGLSNKFVWKNSDSVPHSVTSDTDYKDKISGPFNSIAKTGLIPPQQSYEFTFTAEGEYHYHCEPHPWMQAVVKIAKEKF
ncbi:MAG: plastocyanin/azurin family copper-binding protein [Thermoproteota archaeon]|nr:plastocyanin/azurin family copper-binding protein [Thermoproteota archaeon]